MRVKSFGLFHRRYGTPRHGKQETKQYLLTHKVRDIVAFAPSVHDVVLSRMSRRWPQPCAMGTKKKKTRVPYLKVCIYVCIIKFNVHMTLYRIRVCCDRGRYGRIRQTPRPKSAHRITPYGHISVRSAAKRSDFMTLFSVKSYRATFYFLYLRIIFSEKSNRFRK